jgi:hypothetical protein
MLIRRRLLLLTRRAVALAACAGSRARLGQTARRLGLQPAR